MASRGIAIPAGRGGARMSFNLRPLLQVTQINRQGPGRNIKLPKFPKNFFCTPRAALGLSPPVPAGKESSFEPSLWGDFFITYEPQPLQRSEEWMRERAEKLKEDVQRLFKSCNGTGERILLVDVLQHLGIDHHFNEQIDTALSEILESEFSSSSLHEVALRFRLLREHGHWVSSDVFNKFKGEDGSFNKDTTNDPRGLLSLYNAAHLLVHDEPALEEAIAFARRHLESIRGRLMSPLAEQVKRALQLPLPRTCARVEAVCYISEYEEEEGHNPILLELAKLDFNLLQRLHLKELKAMTEYPYACLILYTL